ncbi:hypothetical protein KP509_21G033700 [Ceratopteris richardii]|uniref:Water stress and hypersensitive response domain-containing protein n=1 Tax=Ceratopteris richardii TaxID=49495 RepID=A0A8T2SBP1_CERRI|nr:hypothetical protein KP509_21G033700 [Ceratopteris richardii]
MANGSEVQARGLFWSDKPAEKEDKAKDDGKEEEIGFFGKVAGFIQNAIGFGKPTAKLSGFHLLKITLERADIVIDLLISNPNPVPIPLVDIKYLIESDGRKLLSGVIPDAGTIHAHGSETVKIPVTLIYKDIKDTYDDIHPGEVIPYRVRVELIADVPILGNLTLPLEKTGEIPIPYKPDVDVEKIELEHLSLEETSALLHLKVENMNKFDLGLNVLEYSFSMADTTIANATLNKAATIEQQGITTLGIPFSFRPKDLGSAVWDVIRGRGAGYSMIGKLEVDTPFGPMHLPFTKEGGNTKLKKKKSSARDLSDED